jgi:hypothetical protein
MEASVTKFERIAGEFKLLTVDKIDFSAGVSVSIRRVEE